MKKLMLFAFTCGIIAGAECATATIDGVTWTYTIENDQVRIGGGSSSETAVSKSTSGEITIPSSVNGYPVTSIANYAFYNCSGISSVVISKNVRSIERFAFSGCSGLTEVTIPSNVTNVGDHAFSYCAGLGSVSIQSGVLAIGAYSFCDCGSLESIVVPQTVESVGGWAFYGCTNLKSISLPFVGEKRGNVDSEEGLFGYIFGWRNYADSGTVKQERPSGSASYSYIPTTLKSIEITDETVIGFGAFSGCGGVESVIVPASVTSIGDKAFYGCRSLTSMRIPAGVSSIGDKAFAFCGELASVSIPSSVRSIGNSAFESCTSLTSVTMAEGVMQIGGCAFWYCSGLGAISIPSSVESIGSDAFTGCNGLTSVSIPSCVERMSVTFPGVYTKISQVAICDGVRSIGSSLFCGCKGLISVTIPASVAVIEANAFDDCSMLKEVHILDAPAWGRIKFCNPTANPLYFAHHLYLDEHEITKFEFQDDLDNVGDYIFTGCTGLMSVILPEGVTNIGVSAFENCTTLSDVSIPNSVVTIRERAFCGCTSLPDDDGDGYIVFCNRLIGYLQNAQNEIIELDDVVEIYDGALSGCKSISRLEFSQKSKLKVIGAAAFKECTELKELELPPSLLSIGDEAFMGCSYLSNVIIPGSVRSVGDRAFKNCTGFTAALIEHGVMSLGAECFYGDWQIVEVDIPSTVATIGDRAFGGDSSIVRIGLRGDCRTVRGIFSNYKWIREATVKQSEDPIVADLFSGCASLKAVHFQGDAPTFDYGQSQSGLSGGPGAVYIDPSIDVDPFYNGTPTSLVTYVEPTSTGWDGISGSHALPKSWPLTGSCRRPIAYWDVPTYLCQFDSNGGTLGVQNTYQYSEKNVSLPPEPVQSGYKFAGWWTQPIGGLRITENTIFIEGVYRKLWAHWVKGHTVFLDPNGGVVVNDFVTYVDEAVYGVLPTPVRSGYAFDGWLCEGQIVSPETRINRDVEQTLVAQWRANSYKVRYRSNGGSGGLVEEGWVYGEIRNLRRNAFIRAGYDFLGWATSPTGGVVYHDCEPLSNLSDIDGQIVELWAVWKEGDAVDPTNVKFVFDGDAEWVKVVQGVTASDGEHSIRVESFWGSGKINDGERSVVKARVRGAGTIGFWWRTDCESFRTYKLDHLSFGIDGAEIAWTNGVSVWSYREYTVDEYGDHELSWCYVKDEEGSAGGDCGMIAAVVWFPRLETLEDYAGSECLELSSSGDSDWFGVEDDGMNRMGCLRSGRLSDGQKSILSATVVGEGRVEFGWKTSCERFRNLKVDRVSFYIDSIEQAWTNGMIDWSSNDFAVAGQGEHTLTWVYEKDEEGSEGEDCAWLCDIHWMPTDADDPIPELDPDAEPTAVRNALEGSADARLAENITTAEHYRTYREWALKIGATDVKASPFAWVSFATDSAALLAKMPTDDDLKVEEFKPSAMAGSFDFTVSVKDVTIGDKASEDNLKKLFGLEGAESLDSSAFSTEKVALDFKEPQDGKLKFTATPAVDNAKSFFMKAKVK